jgi:hypothetical protein
VLDRVPRWVWGLSSRLIASYILVTLAIVVLVEALVLGFQLPSLVNGTQLTVSVAACAVPERTIWLSTFGCPHYCPPPVRELLVLCV